MKFDIKVVDYQLSPTSLEFRDGYLSKASFEKIPPLDISILNVISNQDIYFINSKIYEAFNDVLNNFICHQINERTKMDIKTSLQIFLINAKNKGDILTNDDLQSKEGLFFLKKEMYFEYYD